MLIVKGLGVLGNVVVAGWRWIWRFKFECLSFVLSLVICGLVLYADHLNRKNVEQIAKHDQYVLDQLLIKERTTAAWNERLLIAEEEYNEKLKALERSNAQLNISVDRMSVALSEAKRKYASASEEARAEYANALDIVSGQCIARYCELAKLADGHAIDAKVMSDSWPIVKPP